MIAALEAGDFNVKHPTSAGNHVASTLVRRCLLVSGEVCFWRVLPASAGAGSGEL